MTLILQRTLVISEYRPFLFPSIIIELMTNEQLLHTEPPDHQPSRFQGLAPTISA